MSRFRDWFETLDERDGYFFAGLAMMTVGFYSAWPPLAGIVPGLLVFYVGVWHRPPAPPERGD